jgi:hypothetical protein
LLNGGELIGLFATAIVAMITLASLVVVPDKSPAVAAVIQSVLAPMATACHRCRHLPDNHLNDRTVIEVEPVAPWRRYVGVDWLLHS